MAITAQQYLSQVTAERQAAYSEKLAEAKATGLTSGRAILEANKDPTVAKLNDEILFANSLTSVSSTEDPVTGSSRWWVGTRQYRYQEYSQLLNERGIGVPPDAIIRGPAAGSPIAPATDSESIKVQNNEDTEAYEPVDLEALQAKNDAENAAGQATIDYNTDLAAYNKAVDDIDSENDWRVRLHLAPDADYLYKAVDAGILAPLKDTDGIIFPYTPQIQVQYSADYENYDLVHSNYRGYFYKGSKTENIIITATFTANDVTEANYLLASLHFLKSATKMFYGQDQNRGMPPPICFLTGLGEFQFNNHPCAITSMHYNLPNDVDYIPCGRPSGIAPPVPPKDPAAATTPARLKGAGDQIGVGGKPIRGGKEKNATTNGYPSPYTKATYVPTKIDINFTMIPIQTRDQVSKEFSLRDYANGSLLKKGFW